MPPVEVLTISALARLRPISDGLVALIGNAPPLNVGKLAEQILAVCQRPTTRDELLEIVAGLAPQPTESAAEVLVQQLLTAGLLVSAPEPMPEVGSDEVTPRAKAR